MAEVSWISVTEKQDCVPMSGSQSVVHCPGHCFTLLCSKFWCLKLHVYLFLKYIQLCLYWCSLTYSCQESKILWDFAWPPVPAPLVSPKIYPSPPFTHGECGYPQMPRSMKGSTLSRVLGFGHVSGSAGAESRCIFAGRRWDAMECHGRMA